MAKRMRRNGEDWKVLTVDQNWPAWDRWSETCLTIPAGSLAEARSAARRLVGEGTTRCALMIAPSGLLAGAVASSDAATSGRRAVREDHPYEFIAEAYGVKIATAHPLDPYMDQAEINAIRKARERCDKEWRRARATDSIPRPDGLSQATVRSYVSPRDSIRSEVAFVLVGWKRRLLFSGGSAEAAPAELAAFDYRGIRGNREGRGIGFAEEREPQDEGICILDDEETMRWWESLTSGAFRDMKFSEGFE